MPWNWGRPTQTARPGQRPMPGQPTQRPMGQPTAPQMPRPVAQPTGTAPQPTMQGSPEAEMARKYAVQQKQGMEAMQAPRQQAPATAQLGRTGFQPGQSPMGPGEEEARRRALERQMQSMQTQMTNAGGR